ncbi:hypothetical protein [Sodalis-like endosymbiont of Proechinophthirus fluctus]
MYVTYATYGYVRMHVTWWRKDICALVIAQQEAYKLSMLARGKARYGC